MWRRNRGPSSTDSSKGGHLLSISGLGTQHNSSKLEYGWPSSPRSWANRPAVRPATASIADSARHEQLSEVVSQHEQLITSLNGKVQQLEDQMERMQAEFFPVVKLLSAMIRDAAEQQDQGLSPRKAAGPQQHQQDATTKDQVAPAATADATQPAQCPDDRTVATNTLQTAAAGARHSWGGLFQTSANADPAVRQVLAGLSSVPKSQAVHLEALLATDRDDCGSMHSYCTSLSCGSTQVSAPVFMTDLRPAAKAPSRVPQQHIQQQQLHLPLSWHPLSAADDASASNASSWPLQLDLAEECSPDEIQGMIATVQKGRSTLMDGSSSSSSMDDQHAEQQHRHDLQQALSCLALHAERDEDVRQQLCTPELLCQLVSLLQDSNLSCMQATVHLVWYISRSDTLRQHLQQHDGLLHALLARLTSHDAVTARAAAFALNNLAYDARFRVAMVNAGAVASLIDMLSGCDALGQEAAAAALMMLASEEGNIRAQIVALNGIQALAQVLRYGGPAAQEAAASALENLSLDSECEAALAAEGAVEGLLQVLKDGTTGAMAAAVGALRNLAVNEGLEQHLLAAGTVDVLVQLVNNSKEDVGVRMAALEGLRNLAASSTHAGDKLIQAGGAHALVDAARSLPAAGARTAALGALLVLSCDANHRKAVMVAGVAGVLVHAALSGSQTAKEYAARALANLATTEASRIELLQEGAATVLAHLLKSEVSLLKAAAGRQEPTDGKGCCLAAARALQNLSKYRPGCKQMLDAGCIPPLASALDIPGLIATAATSALCSLCTSKRALQELANDTACTSLVAAAAKPKHLTPRGQKHALKLLQRLVKGPGFCRSAVQQQLAALGLQLV